MLSILLAPPDVVVGSLSWVKVYRNYLAKSIEFPLFSYNPPYKLNSLKKHHKGIEFIPSENGSRYKIKKIVNQLIKKTKIKTGSFCISVFDERREYVKISNGINV